MTIDLMRFLVLVFIYCFPLLLKSQMLIDDFETDTDLTNWERIEGFAEVQGANEYSGALAIRLHRLDAPIGAHTTYLHRTFSDNFGIYEMACFADGPVSDVQFIFQYLDAQNYYSLSVNPRNTDNPLMMLWKVVDGVYTVLDSIGPVVDLHRWFILRVERYCAGEISLYIDDELKISVQDRSIVDPGKIGLAARAESTYFDDITFEKVNSNIVVDLEEYICSGRFYEVDTNRYSEEGYYVDTLTTAIGCDSIVRLRLNIVPHYLVTERDTICSHESYIFGADTLRESGRYNQALQSIHGCDSLVELSLLVLGSDTTITDTSICQGSFILFKNDTIFQSGTYLDTIFSEDGCFGITGLRVNVGLPGLDLGEDRTVCFEDTPNIPLRATGFDSISWFDGRNQETIAISAPGTYWVEVFEGDCSASDTIQIFEVCEPKTRIYIPNAFSPNGDKVNDIFMPLLDAIPTTFSMTIFNRWGGLVHHSTNFSAGWDGHDSGEKDQAGVYMYLIEVDGVQYTGTVTLVR